MQKEIIITNRSCKNGFKSKQMNYYIFFQAGLLSPSSKDNIPAPFSNIGVHVSMSNGSRSHTYQYRKIKQCVWVDSLAVDVRHLK